MTASHTPDEIPPSAEAAPLILDVKGNALDDGPGIRSVVFFKGCPLACVWCHNPESKKARPELAFDAKACTGCEACLAVCDAGALARGNPGYVDRQVCIRCFACAAVCPSGALAQVGQVMPVEGLVEKLLRDKPFYDTSGGGVTFSGGEPTLFMPYLSSLAAALQAAGVSTLLETCGHFDADRFETRVLPHLDAIYFDLKLFDGELHRRYCGLSNDIILTNFIRLWALSRGSHFSLLPRIPLVPGLTATQANIRAWVSFLKIHRVGRVKLLAYNPLWPAKAARIGEDNPHAAAAALQDWMPPADVARLEGLFHEAGIETL